MNLTDGFTLNAMGQLERLVTKRKSWDEYFLDLADMVATRSTCNRAHHGAVLVTSDHRIISTGYNGSAPGEPHCEDVGCLIVDNHCVRTVDRHAENNCLGNWFAFDSDIMYVTAKPCSLCQVFVKEGNVYKVIYRNEYLDGKFTPVGIKIWLPQESVSS